MEPAGGQMTLFSLAGSRDLANPTAQPVSGLAKMMNATYGPRCLERYGRLAPDTLWAKTFPGLLVGMEGWCSMRCRLTWKLRGTKSSRLYFLLQVSALPTEGIESGLLPTVQTQGLKVCDQNGKTQFMKLELLPTPDCSDRRSDNSHQWGLSNYAKNGLLPTPRANKVNQMDLNNENLANRNKSNLEEAVAKWVTQGMLPTPTATSDVKGGCTRIDPNRQNDTLAHAIHGQMGTPGKTSQLNPRFVLEMMGFQPNHCDSAFEKIAWAIYQKKKSTKSFQKRLQSGETKPSKQQETP